MLIFEVREPEYLQKTSQCTVENQKTQPTYCMTPDLGIEPYKYQGLQFGRINVHIFFSFTS